MRDNEAKYYDDVEGAIELQGDPRPISKTAQWARKRALREGRLRIEQSTPLETGDVFTPLEQPPAMPEAPPSS